MSDLIHWRPHIADARKFRETPYACGMLKGNYAEFPQFSHMVTCPVCILLLADERREARTARKTTYEDFARRFLHKGASEALIHNLTEHIRAEVRFWFDSESNEIEMDLVRIAVENKS